MKQLHENSQTQANQIIELDKLRKQAENKRDEETKVKLQFETNLAERKE